MALQAPAKSDLTHVIMMEYMINPIQKLLNNSTSLSIAQLRESTTAIKALTQIINSFDDTSTTLNSKETRNEQDAAIMSTVKDICFPLFYSLHLLPDSSKMKSERRKTLACIIQCIRVALDHISDSALVCKVVLQTVVPLGTVTNKIEQMTLKLRDADYHKTQTDEPDLLTIIELFEVSFDKMYAMEKVFSNLKCYGTDKEEFLKFVVNAALVICETKSLFGKALNAVAKLLPLCPKNLQEKLLSDMWQKFTKTLLVSVNGDVDNDCLRISLCLLHNLRDYFFPVDNTEDKKLILASHLGDEFWLIVQAGLLSSEPSQRKMSMYMIKRIVDTCQQNGCIVNHTSSKERDVDCKDDTITEESQVSMFWWHPKHSSTLATTWEDFVIMMEVLEEKQVHVIKPLLPRINNLISACSVQCLETKKVSSLMHTSWLVTVLTRCFHHDSHFMSRWGAVTLLTLDMKKVPFVQQGQMKFLSSDLIKYLQENKLYTRYEGSQQERCSPVREAVVKFFATLLDSLCSDEKAAYLTNLLQTICDNTWGSIPLVFLFQGLSLIAPEPILSSENVELVRRIIQACLITHEVPTRGAIQCFITQMLMNLMDPEQVKLSQFVMTIAALNKEESFQRGTTLWNQMVQWLNSAKIQQSWKDKQCLDYAKGYLEQEKWQDSEASVVFDGYKVLGISRLLLLFADMAMTYSASQDSKARLKEIQSCCLGLVLSEMSQALANIGVRAYVNIKQVDASLALLNCIVKELGDSKMDSYQEVRDMVKLNVTANFENMVLYIIKRISQDLTRTEDLDQIKFYADVISTVGSLCQKIKTPIQDLLKCVGNIFTAAVNVKNKSMDPTIEMLTLSAVTILNSTFQIVLGCDSDDAQQLMWKCISQIPSVHDIPMPFRKRNSSSGVSNVQLGRFISHYVSSLWQCRKGFYTLQHRLGHQHNDLSSLLDDAMEALSIGSGDSDIAVIQTVHIVTPQLVLQPSAAVDIPQFLRLAWSKLMEERKNVLFWQRLETLIPAVIHPALLKQDKKSEIASYIEEFLAQVLELANTRTGITYLIMDRLTEVLKGHDESRVIAKWLADTLIDASVCGDIYEKGKRLMLDIFAYIESLGDQLATNQITSSSSKNDMNSRILIINWLSTLKPSRAADKEFAIKFLRSLKDKYLHIANLTTYKQFYNSYHHRLKHRMLLVFLLLSDFIQEDACQEFLDDLWQGLILECHPSVRHSLEWLLMRLLLRYPSFLPSLWQTFSKFTEKRSICICSLMMILTHLGPKLPAPIQTDYYSRAFSQALSWSFAHHYNTRIFAQASLLCLWRQCQQQQLTHLLQTFHMVQSTADFIYHNANSSSTIIIKLMDNFIYSSFDPIRDFSAETIFHTLPRLACIADDEWIFPEQLVKMDPVWNVEQGKIVPLLNSTSDLANCEEGPWRMKAQIVNKDTIVETTDGDFQKKIVSWRQMAPDQETEAELITQRRRLKDGGLILVTSLIEKVPNLGGLCRTSEIFGVSEFVISNLTHLEDHMFQSLSVSAQKWLNITEVPRHQVTKYMDEKKAEGYILVGVEQTANSVPLDKYVFPKNTLLLLGNEKEGIPPDMLPLLDVCVEIPQQGIIRSLNVHVCGALIVWEYTRQFLSIDSD